MRNKFKIIILLVFFSSVAYSQNLPLKDKLMKADSLYASQKYTEAFQVYKEIYDDLHFTSPAMLIKMAFIREGLGDYVSALFFLNQYYELTSDRKVLVKMREIAEEHELKGYEYSDNEYFFGLYQKHKVKVLMVLLSLGIFLLAYIYRQKVKRNRISYGAAFVQLIVFAGSLIILNDYFTREYVIIRENNTLLKTGPSAGAEPVEMIGKGHRVVLVDEVDVWSKIQWDGQEVYVRSANLRAL